MWLLPDPASFYSPFMSLAPPDFNPYASPASEPDNPPVASTLEMVRVVKQFRQQMHALGALWFILGALAAFVAGGMLISNDPEIQEDQVAVFITVGLLFILGAILLGVGVLTCLKNMPAVWVGLSFSYLMVVVSLLVVNICGIVVLGAAILQAHRVIRWANDLQRKGILLTARPQDIQVLIDRPPQTFGSDFR